MGVDITWNAMSDANERIASLTRTKGLGSACAEMDSPYLAYAVSEIGYKLDLESGAPQSFFAVPKCPEGTMKDGGRCKIINTDPQFWEDP